MVSQLKGGLRLFQYFTADLYVAESSPQYNLIDCTQFTEGLPVLLSIFLHLISSGLPASFRLPKFSFLLSSTIYYNKTIPHIPTRCNIVYPRILSVSLVAMMLDFWWTPVHNILLAIERIHNTYLVLTNVNLASVFSLVYFSSSKPLCRCSAKYRSESFPSDLNTVFPNGNTSSNMMLCLKHLKSWRKAIFPSWRPIFAPSFTS